MRRGLWNILGLYVDVPYGSHGDTTCPNTNHLMVGIYNDLATPSRLSIFWSYGSPYIGEVLAMAAGKGEWGTCCVRFETLETSIESESTKKYANPTKFKTSPMKAMDTWKRWRSFLFWAPRENFQGAKLTVTLLFPPPDTTTKTTTGTRNPKMKKNLPETNSEWKPLENGWLEDEISFRVAYLQGLLLLVSGRILPSSNSSILEN